MCHSITQFLNIYKHIWSEFAVSFYTKNKDFCTYKGSMDHGRI